MNRLLALLTTAFILQPAGATPVNYRHLLNRWQDLIHGSKSSSQNRTLGVINGGGASGMECTNSSGKTTVRLLDMKELSDVWNLQPMPFTGTDEDALDLLAEKMVNHFWNPWTVEKSVMKKYMLQLIRDFIAGATFLKSGQDLNAIDDVHTPIHDPNCKAVQIAMIYNESQFLVDTDLWNQLPAIDKAALIGHELVYSAARLNGEADSINARKFISYLFSTRSLTPVADGAPGLKDIVDCYAYTKEGGRFKSAMFGFEQIQPDGTKTTNFVFTFLDGKNPLFRTSAVAYMPFAEWKAKTGLVVEHDINVDTFPWQKNTATIKLPEKIDGDYELSYFNQNGELLGGPWLMDCVW